MKFYVRIRAAEVLGNIGSYQAVDALINTLNDDNCDVRRIATYALGKIGSERAVDALISALNHKNSDVRRRSTDSLRKIGSERAVDALINALNHKNSDIRWSAASALGEIGSEIAVDGLIKALNHENKNVSKNAAYALAKIACEIEVDTPINALNNQDFGVRSRAADALTKTSIGTAIYAKIKTSNHEESHVRSQAANTLQEIPVSDKIAQLWNLLLNGKDEAKDIILEIQERYKFYNHEIFHSPPIENEQKSTQPQKILILAAIPHGLRSDIEIRSIEECIRRAVRRDMFEVAIKTAVRGKDIRRAIAEEKPQVVHFCGHGLENGSLLLEDDMANDKPVLPSALAELFQLHADYVNCVVFNACHSIKAAEKTSQYINYAIGMNQPIQDTSAIKFTEGFYDGLGYETPEEEDVFQRAFQEGLIAIKLDNLSQAEIPVIKTKY